MAAPPARVEAGDRGRRAGSGGGVCSACISHEQASLDASYARCHTFLPRKRVTCVNSSKAMSAPVCSGGGEAQHAT
jgi:hypothetical protein